MIWGPIRRKAEFKGDQIIYSTGVAVVYRRLWIVFFYDNDTLTRLHKDLNNLLTYHNRI